MIDGSFNEAKMTKTNHWFQHLHCEANLLFSVLYRCKLNILRFWTVGRTNILASLRGYLVLRDPGRLVVLSL